MRPSEGKEYNISDWRIPVEFTRSGESSSGLGRIEVKNGTNQ